MLSYPIDEAEELLSSKLGAAKQSLSNCEEDLDFLREQITVRSSECGVSNLESKTDRYCRLWRSLRHEYTTGMSP